MLQTEKEAQDMKKIQEWKARNPQFGIVLLIVFGFALPVVAGIAVYKVVRKMKKHTKDVLEPVVIEETEVSKDTNEDITSQDGWTKDEEALR